MHSSVFLTTRTWIIERAVQNGLLLRAMRSILVLHTSRKSLQDESYCTWTARSIIRRENQMLVYHTVLCARRLFKCLYMLWTLYKRMPTYEQYQISHYISYTALRDVVSIIKSLQEKLQTKLNVLLPMLIN